MCSRSKATRAIFGLVVGNQGRLQVREERTPTPVFRDFEDGVGMVSRPGAMRSKPIEKRSRRWHTVDEVMGGARGVAAPEAGRHPLVINSPGAALATPRQLSPQMRIQHVVI